MAYVDGFVIPVPKKKMAAYRKMARAAAKVWMKYGALDYVECAGDDLNIKGVLPFTKLAKTKPSETVVFSYIVYKTKAHRKAVLKKVMQDPLITSFQPGDMPFDPKRMAYGGFKAIVEAKR